MGLTRWVEVGAFSVMVEDDEDLDGAAVGFDGVRDNGGELRGLSGLVPFSTTTVINLG